VLRGVRFLPPGLPGPEAAVIRAVVALAADRSPAPADLAATQHAQEEGNRLALRISAALAYLTASAGAGVAPGAALAQVDVVAALVAELPDEEGTARRECVAVLSDLRAQELLRSDLPTAKLLTGLRTAATAAGTAGFRRMRSRAVGNLALLEALEGHLTRAVDLAEEAERFATEEGIDETAREPAAATALSWVHLRRYTLIEAREWLGRARARERSAGPPLPGTGPLQAVLQAQQFRLRHEYDLAGHALESHLHDVRLPRWVSEQVVTEVIRLAVARGHVAEGLELLRDRGHDRPWSRRLEATVGLYAGDPPSGLPTEVERSSSVTDAVETSVVQACLLLEEGHVPAAVDELAKALELARPELLRWPFVDTPPQARRLLRTNERLKDPGAWLNPSSGVRPRAAPNGVGAPAAGPQVVQDLSDREMEVLRYLADMLSTPEIAATMFISVNTVRTHIRSILRKLAVSRRNQAVRKARERGLL
jgi:LuxR family maltose regulon positive regulatory protein